MKNFSMNFIVKLSTIITVCIMSFLILVRKEDVAFIILCTVGLIVGIYLVLYSFISSFKVYEDKLVIKKPFKLYNLYWHDIGFISAVEYRQNNYNIYLNPKKETKHSNVNKSILINWQFNNHKELVKSILSHCDKNENTYIDKKVYKAIGD